MVMRSLESLLTVFVVAASIPIGATAALAAEGPDKFYIPVPVRLKRLVYDLFNLVFYE